MSGDVWVMGADGSQARNVTNTGGVHSQAVWFPDGRLAFLMRPDGESPIQIFTVDIDGGDPVQLTNREGGYDYDNYHSMVISPDGRYLAVTEYGIIMVVSVESGEIYEIGRGTFADLYHAFLWSPDSSRLAFAAEDGRLYTMNPDGSDAVEVSTFSPVSGLLGWFPP